MAKVAFACLTLLVAMLTVGFIMAENTAEGYQGVPWHQRIPPELELKHRNLAAGMLELQKMLLGENGFTDVNPAMLFLQFLLSYLPDTSSTHKVCYPMRKCTGDEDCPGGCPECLGAEEDVETPTKGMCMKRQ